MKKGTILLFAAVLAAALLSSCVKQSLKATYDKQTTFIEGFITAQMKADPKATLTRNGDVYRLTLHDTLDKVFGKRDSLADGGRVSLLYACFTLTGNSLTTSNLVSTNARQIADAAKWNLSDTTRFKLDTLTLDNSLVRGLRNGLAGVQQYDEGFILFTGEYGFGNVERGTIPARSALAYHFWIENIDNEK